MNFKFLSRRSSPTFLSDPRSKEIDLIIQNEDLRSKRPKPGTFHFEITVSDTKLLSRRILGLESSTEIIHSSRSKLNFVSILKSENSVLLELPWFWREEATGPGPRCSLGLLSHAFRKVYFMLAVWVLWFDLNSHCWVAQEKQLWMSIQWMVRSLWLQNIEYDLQLYTCGLTDVLIYASFIRNPAQEGSGKRRIEVVVPCRLELCLYVVIFYLYKMGRHTGN